MRIFLAAVTANLVVDLPKTVGARRLWVAVSADRRLMSMIAAAASPVVLEMILVCACFSNGQ